MTKKKTGLDALDTFSQPDKPKETAAGGFNRELSRTHKSNKPYVKHSSIYLEKSIHKKVMHVIHDDDELTLSDVVEKLLLEWLEKRA